MAKRKSTAPAPFLRFNLREQANTTCRVTVEGFATQSYGQLLIALEGFGECTASDGKGTPIMLELLDGRPRLLVWSDINQEDPTHVIDLSGASEDRRKET